MSTNNDLTLEKLEIKKELNRLTTELQTFRELHSYKLNEVEKDTDHLKHILNGNGEVGLVGKVEANKNDIKTIKDAHKENGFIAKTALGGLILEQMWKLVFHH